MMGGPYHSEEVLADQEKGHAGAGLFQSHPPVHLKKLHSYPGSQI